MSSIRTSAARGRTALLSGLGAFAAGQLALGAVLLLRPWGLCDPDFAGRLGCLGRRTAAAPRPCTLVFLGSSRVEQGVRAGEMEAPLAQALGRPVAAVNFGKPAATLLRSLLYWKRLRRHGVRPDLLVVELMPPLLHDGFHDLNEGYLPTALLSWDDLDLLDDYGGPGRATARRDWWQARACPGYGLRRALVSKAFPELLPQPLRLVMSPMANDSGDALLRELPLTPERHAEALRLTAAFTTILKEVRLGERKARALAELLASCREVGVPVALLVTPEGPMFRSMYPPGRWEALLARLEHTAAEAGAALINAHEWMEDEGDFRDSHHLTLPAAEHFSRRLAREALLPLLEHAPAPGGSGPAAAGVASGRSTH
jgi:hypothetical protein